MPIYSANTENSMAWESMILIYITNCTELHVDGTTTLAKLQ